jgi:hypothetical protein
MVDRPAGIVSLVVPTRLANSHSSYASSHDRDHHDSGRDGDPAAAQWMEAYEELQWRIPPTSEP